MYRESLFRRSVKMRGCDQTREIRTNLDQRLKFSILLGPDDHPEVLLKFRVRLASDELFRNQLLS